MENPKKKRGKKTWMIWGGNTPIFGNHPYVDDFWMKKRRISSKKQKDQLVVANTVGFLKDFWSQKNLAKVRKVRHNTLGFFDWRILVTCLKEEVQEFVLFITWKNWNQNNELETWQFDPVVKCLAFSKRSAMIHKDAAVSTILSLKCGGSVRHKKTEVYLSLLVYSSPAWRCGINFKFFKSQKLLGKGNSVGYAVPWVVHDGPVDPHPEFIQDAILSTRYWF